MLKINIYFWAQAKDNASKDHFYYVKNNEMKKCDSIAEAKVNSITFSIVNCGLETKQNYISFIVDQENEKNILNVILRFPTQVIVNDKFEVFKDNSGRVSIVTMLLTKIDLNNGNLEDIVINSWKNFSNQFLQEISHGFIREGDKEMILELLNRGNNTSISLRQKKYSFYLKPVKVIGFVALGFGFWKVVKSKKTN